MRVCVKVVFTFLAPRQTKMRVDRQKFVWKLFWLSLLLVKQRWKLIDKSLYESCFDFPCSLSKTDRQHSEFVWELFSMALLASSHTKINCHKVSCLPSKNSYYFLSFKFEPVQSQMKRGQSESFNSHNLIQNGRQYNIYFPLYVRLKQPSEPILWTNGHFLTSQSLFFY